MKNLLLQNNFNIFKDLEDITLGIGKIKIVYPENDAYFFLIS